MQCARWILRSRPIGEKRGGVDVVSELYVREGGREGGSELDVREGGREGERERGEIDCVCVYEISVSICGGRAGGRKCVWMC